MKYVAGPGVGPGLGDYEPPVQPYTTPHVYWAPGIISYRLVCA